MTDINLEVEAFTAQVEAVEQELDELLRDVRGGEPRVVGTAVEYAIYLEFGTRNMDPKPFFRPALAELRTQGIDGFVAANTGTTLEALDDVQSIIDTVALALERRIKEIITAKGLIDTGTLRASVAAVDNAGELKAEADVSVSA